MDGLDTFKSVLEIYPHQKAIIVSGFSETERVKAAKALGAGAYVRKPYIKEKLGLAVRMNLADPREHRRISEYSLPLDGEFWGTPCSKVSPKIRENAGCASPELVEA